MAIHDVYLDNVFIQWNEVGGQNVVLGIDNEQQKIFNNIAVLNQIPDIATGVAINGMFEIKDNKPITLVSQFKVNYANGFITFHSDLNNTLITISHYAGRGIIYYPSSRIYTRLSEDGKTIEQTYQDMVDSINKYEYTGIYNNSKTYQTNQQVYYNGSTYIAILTTLGNLPTDDNYWCIFTAGNNFLGDFNDTAQYYQKDCVQYDKAIYQCISKPPIGELPTNSDYWMQMISLNDIYLDYIDVLKPEILSATANANNARYKEDYSTSVEYKVNNIVRYNNSLYICKSNTTGNVPTNTTYWDNATKAFTWQGVYNASTNYKVLDVVSYLGSSYVCIQNSTGNIPTNNTYFNVLALKGEKGVTLSPKGAYNNAETYLKDDLVFYTEGAISGVFYAKQTTIGNIPTNTTYWEVFLSGGGNMNTAIYDVDNTGVVDDSQKLGGELPSYYGKSSDFDTLQTSFESHKADSAYSIKNYGAHSLNEAGYETFDSSQAILDCIAAMPAGKKMLFPTGHYRIDSNILVDKSIDVDFGNSVIDCYTDTPFTFTGTLKSTHSVTADYVEATSKNSLTLDSVEGIEVGDLINVISSELYDTARAYYFKGGNAIVTGIAGNTVYFNLVFPFDMTAASIVVKIYDAIEVSIENIKMLQGKNTLADSNYGLRIMFAKNSSIKNIKTDNFKSNISIERSVNVGLDYVDTGHAKNSSADAWDGYGIAIYSSTNVSGKHITTNSGQHGLTWGGQEVNFGLHFEDSVFKAEVWSLGVGNHANLYDVIFINCKIFGFALSNNVTCINCDIMENELTTHQNRIACAESSRYANYRFTKCRFSGKAIYLLDNYQQVCPTRKYVGNIIFDDCSDFTLGAAVNAVSDGAKIAEIEKIKISDCMEYTVSISDIVDKLIVENSNSTLNKNIITQISVNEVCQKIKTIVLKNISIPRRFDGIGIQNADTVIVKGLKYNDTDYGNGQETFKNIGRLYLENYENSTAQRGLSLVSIGMLTIINSDLKFNGVLNTVLANATIVEGRALKIGTEYMDIRTSIDGKRYKIQLDTNGAQVPTLIV